MNRRHFIKASVLGTGALALGFQAFASKKNNEFFFDRKAWQSARDIPVAYEVDVLVTGGTLAAVIAASEAAKAGASVMLITTETYLGDDLCAHLHLWRDPEYAPLHHLAQKVLPENNVLSPFEIKSALDQELINQKIPFLFSCYVTDILADSEKKPAGIVMSNRAGRQAIKAKWIIDATPFAQVARIAGAQFRPFTPGTKTFRFTVTGNKPRTELSQREWPIALSVNEKQYKSIDYTLELPLEQESWAAFSLAEQKARSLVWDADQVDAADWLFYIPENRMIGRKQLKKLPSDWAQESLDAFFPRDCERLTVLSNWADYHPKLSAQINAPGGLSGVAAAVGKSAAEKSRLSVIPAELTVPGETPAEYEKGDVRELLGGLRPYLTTGHIRSQAGGLPILGEYDVVVLGGGTAGAPAALSATREGAKTLLLEYLHALGGMMTAGYIAAYYHGYREGFTKEIDQSVRDLGGDNPRKDSKDGQWVVDWKKEWFRREIHHAGGEIWFGVLGCGAYAENNVVKGIVVATPLGRGVVLAHTVIDSTGSADIAIAAGAPFRYTDRESVAVQGAGLPAVDMARNYENSDWTFTNDTDPLDVWRTFVTAKHKYEGKYDLGKLLQTRERRRIIGDFEVGVLDVYNGRTYPDILSLHLSSFDTHGFTVSPFFTLKPPEHSGVDVTAYVPLRALLPQGIEGIIVTGLGASAHRDAMPVIRMQPCLQNQGFAVGKAAAMVARENTTIRRVDIKALQKQLVAMGNLPALVLTAKDNYPPALETLIAAVGTVINNFQGLEIILWDFERALPLLRKAYTESKEYEHRLVYAHILGIHGYDDGWKELETEIRSYTQWDEGWNFKGMGQFGASMSRLDSLIIALGLTKREEALPCIIEKARLLTPQSEFSHFRAIAVALESIARVEGADILLSLLQMPGVQGHAYTTIEEAIAGVQPSKIDVTTRNNSLRELFLGAALYRCGDPTGLGREILSRYAKDLRGHYYNFASGILKEESQMP